MQTARRSRPECSLWADRQGQCTGLLVLSWWWWSPETMNLNYVEDSGVCRTEMPPAIVFGFQRSFPTTHIMTDMLFLSSRHQGRLPALHGELAGVGRDSLTVAVGVELVDPALLTCTVPEMRRIITE